MLDQKLGFSGRWRHQELVHEREPFVCGAFTVEKLLQVRFLGDFNLFSRLMTLFRGCDLDRGVARQMLLAVNSGLLKLKLVEDELRQEHQEPVLVCRAKDFQYGRQGPRQVQGL